MECVKRVQTLELLCFSLETPAFRHHDMMVGHGMSQRACQHFYLRTFQLFIGADSTLLLKELNRYSTKSLMTASDMERIEQVLFS